MTGKPHDALFRSTFAQLEHARATLRALLPAAVSRHVDWPSLELVPGSFITDELRETITDLLYTVRLFDGSPAQLHLLFEHQSQVEPFMSLRLLDYMVRIWRTQRREDPDTKSLVPILPIVLHHSERGWTAPTRFEQLFSLAPSTRVDLAPYLPSFDFILEDLSQRGSDELHAVATTALARLAFFCLRDGRRGEALLDSLPAWADLYHEVSSANNGVEAVAAIMRYIHLVTEIGQPRIERRLLEVLGPEAKEAFVTLGEKLIEQGRQQGQRRLVIKLAELKFGRLDPEERQQIEAADEPSLERMAERVLVALRFADLLETS